MTLVSDPGTLPGRALARRLLDGTQPVDAAARQEIDEALDGRSTDPVVHAAALLLDFTAGADLRLSRSHASGWWIPGLDELIHSGHLDAAAYMLPKLQAAFPKLPYLENMAFVFDRLPAPTCNGRDPFVDDRGRDVQFIKTPGVDTVIIAFCGGKHTLGMPVNLLDRWLAGLDSHLIYLRDRRKIGYTRGVPVLGRGMEATIRSLKRLIRETGARRVVCLGNSAGGSGALRYASALRADRVLALAPITGGPEHAEKVAPHLPPGAVNPWGDLVPMYLDGAGVRVHIVYGEQNAGDRQQSVRMAGLPGVTVEALEGWEQHHLIHGLLRADRLGSLLQWLVSGDGVVDLGAVSSTTIESSST